MLATLRAPMPPRMTARCFIDRQSSYEDGLPHLEGEINAVNQIRGRVLEASIALSLPYRSDPLLSLNLEDEEGHVQSLENIPADIETIDMMITLLTELRATFIREIPAMLEHATQFDAFVERNRSVTLA